MVYLQDSVVPGTPGDGTLQIMTDTLRCFGESGLAQGTACKEYTLVTLCTFSFEEKSDGLELTVFLFVSFNF